MDVLRTKNTILFLILLLPLIFFLTQPVTAQTISCAIDRTAGECRQDAPASCDGSPDCEVQNTVCRAATTGPPHNTPWCVSGCCCAGEGTINPTEWNLGDQTSQEQVACYQINRDVQGTYLWSPDSGNFDNCASFCMGQDTTPPTPEPEQFTVQGTVFDRDGDPVEGIQVSFGPIGTSVQTTSTGSYTLTVNEGKQGSVYARNNDFTCEGQSQQITVQGDLQDIDITLSCDVVVCTVDSKPTITPTLIRGQDKIQLDLTAGTGCPFIQYVIQIYQDGSNAPSSTLETTQSSIQHLNVNPETEYCYQVTATYQRGITEPSSRDNCITTGVLECMQGNEDASWCRQATQDTPAQPLSCDENNQINEGLPCGAGEVCAIGPNGLAQCTPRPPCEKCNGLFGLLSNLAHRINIPLLGASFQDCTSPLVQQYCFLDRTPHIKDTYRSCSEIQSCEEYKTMAACNDDPCNTELEGCSWKSIDGAQELTLGVCQPNNDQTPSNCAACNDLFGGCSESLCETIGEREGSVSECYFDELANNLVQGPLGCIAQEQVACRFYDTRQDCTGGAPDAVRVDVTYDSQGNRIGGTHELSAQSNDVFGIGTCRWHEEEQGEGFCYKDALGNANTQAPQDDCEQLGNFGRFGSDCFIDATPPVTTITVAPVSIPANRIQDNVFVSVSDNFYSANDLKTFFCLSQADNCYPTKETLPGAVFAIIDDLEEGAAQEVYLRFYSKDPSGNLEVVNSTTITLVDTGAPILDLDNVIIR